MSGCALLWCVLRSIPRMYLLDEQGVIRYEKLRGKSLEDAVKKLVEK